MLTKKKIVLLIGLLGILFTLNYSDVKAADATKRNIEDAKITGLHDYPYTGTYTKPEGIVLTYDGEVLTEKVDYTITFSGYYGPGPITVTIKGIRDYEGTLVTEYEIIRNTTYVLKISNETVSLALNSSQIKTLSLYTTPNVYIDSKKVTWNSSNPEIADIDATGTLTPKQIGTTTITGTFNGQSVTSQVTVTEFLKGDVNRDGKVTIKDVMEIMYFYTKKKTPTEYSYLAGDMNNDGKLTLKDASQILAIYMKKDI